MNDSVLYAVLAFLIVDAAALLGLILYKLHKAAVRRRILHYGDHAEREVKEYLEYNFPGAVILHDVFLKTRRGSTQIDHILISKWGLFLIETKSHNGRINVGKREWVQIYGEKVVRFHSPVLQNESHQRALRHVLSPYRALKGVPVRGLVVFTSKKVHFSKRVTGVLRLDELAPFIKSGGTETRSRAVLTAKGHQKYLTRQKISALEKVIRRNLVHSPGNRYRHEKTVRHLNETRNK